VLFDGFLERNFAWRHWREGIRAPEVLAGMRNDGTFDDLATSEERGLTPYTRPWIGALHNPPSMPRWFHYEESPQSIFAKGIWRRSLPHCIGLFTFSDYHARWLREQTGRPVSVVVHPTEIPERQFDFSRFMANPAKKVIQVGWWLRRLNAIYELPIGRGNRLHYEKVRLVPEFFPQADAYLKQLMATERTMLPDIMMDPAYLENTRDVLQVSNEEYDRLLSENIVLLWLYDANANNAVIECIARATPLLVNPLLAVVEYLGQEYPLYFTTLSEAAAKALDPGLILDAHNYLATCETRAKLTPEFFLRSVRESGVYQRI